MGVKRLLAILPNSMEKEFLELWKEFETGQTPDASFAKSIDRVPPLLHNIHGGGHSWTKHGIPKEKVFSLNQRIENGSEKLWSVMRDKLENAVVEGILN
jgi:putative hydrolase of HD superfamily